MFGSKTKKTGRPTAPSILATDMHVFGNIHSDGVIDINGKVTGNVKAERVYVRAEGMIVGDVEAHELHLYGRIEGIVRARTAHLYRDGCIEGTLLHEALSVEDGAFVDGQMKRMDKLSPEAMEEITGSKPVEMLSHIKLISSKESR